MYSDDEDPLNVSPYLKRPLRSLKQVLSAQSEALKRDAAERANGGDQRMTGKRVSGKRNEAS